MKINFREIIFETMTDGPGLRTAIYCQGCGHHCPGCHNPETWDFGPVDVEGHDVEEIFDIILSDVFSDVTFTGGDPLYQVEAFTELAKMIKNKTNKTIWCYTGFTYEEIKESPEMRQILPFLDVLVDGPFILSQRDTDLKFRGSRNQRIIHLKDGEIDYIED